MFIKLDFLSFNDNQDYTKLFFLTYYPLALRKEYI